MSATVNQLLAVMAALRDPKTGCPWDREQTYSTIVPHTLEETYEVIEAIEQGNFDQLQDELGDLLFQVVFYCQLAEEEGRFDFKSVVTGLVDKLTRRHPHVFGDETVDDADKVNALWERVKAEERREKGNTKKESVTENSAADLFSSIPAALPALSRAQKLSRRAASVGFDWDNPDAVRDKLREELDELAVAVADADQEAQFEELGDVLFSAVNYARHLEIDAEQALRAGNEKFARRFIEMAGCLEAEGHDLHGSTIEQMEVAWLEAKKSMKTAVS